MNLFKFRLIICWIGAALFFGGCSEAEIKQPVPEIVRKKIYEKPDKIKSAPSSEALLQATSQIVSYNPARKIDPFEPLIKDESGKHASENLRSSRRTPLTPLEMLDLSQLKLTATIRTASGGGYKAMLEEATGKGYLIGLGTYVGIHSGRVTNIMKDRVVVEEEVEDDTGTVVTRKSEIKFHKPSGE